MGNESFCTFVLYWILDWVMNSRIHMEDHAWLEGRLCYNTSISAQASPFPLEAISISISSFLVDNNDSMKGKQCFEGRQWIISTSRWASPNAQASPNKVCFHLSSIFIFGTINYYSYYYIMITISLWWWKFNLLYVILLTRHF